MSTPAVTIRTISASARDFAQASPDALALTDDVQALSYGAWLADAEALAAGMQQIGLAKGDVVSFQLPNWIEAGVINLAANLTGLLCNPIVPIYRERELEAILRDARTSCFFVPGSWNGFDYAAMAQRLQAALPDLRSIVLVRAARPTGTPGCDRTTASCCSLRPEPPVVPRVCCTARSPWLLRCCVPQLCGGCARALAY